MKVGDKIKLDKQTGKIIRFYPNQSTILVELDKGKKLVYWDYFSAQKV
jgi:hypothetical protein